MKSMKLDLELQNPFKFDTIPPLTDCQHWVESALIAIHQNEKSALVIRFVDEQEGVELNNTYRHKNQATNVLSFPYEAPDFGAEIPELADEDNYLGDLVLCEPVVKKEASQQSKTLQSHWAHLIVHGTLHLKGFDHLNDKDAEAMEALEIKILKGLGFKNPYTLKK